MPPRKRAMAALPDPHTDEPCSAPRLESYPAFPPGESEPVTVVRCQECGKQTVN
jgi:hypothetical protein